jgi:hypothetical protein
MKIHLLLIAAALGVAACSREAEPPAAAGQAGQTQAAPGQAEGDTSRTATYNPNLVVDPATIVWDDPEKKRRWEQMQREAQAAAGAQAAPAQPPAAR